MDPLWIGLLSIGILIFLCAMGIHVAFALMMVAGGGLIIIIGPDALYGFARMTAVQWSYNFMLAVIPLFMLMGYVFAESGVAPEVFDACRAWFGRLPGGLAIATTVANGGFGAMSGSSLAAVAMFNRLAFPEMWKAGYDKRFCAGVITVTATLAGIIPPSVTIVLVGMLTDISIGQLLLAGYFTGLLFIAVYSVIAIILARFVGWGGKGKPEAFTWKQRFVSLKGVWVVGVVVLIILGGIYLGVFSPTEAAAVGVSVAVVTGVLKRKLKWKGFTGGSLSAARTTGMIFALLIGALTFSRYLSIMGFPRAIGEMVNSWGLSGMAVVAIFMVMYIFLGMFMDPLGMLVTTLPFVFPTVMAFGYSGVWFGMLLVIMSYTAAVTPPVALQLYVSKATAPVEANVGLTDIIVGSIPFLGGNLISAALIIIFPVIPLWLPEHMMGGLG